MYRRCVHGGWRQVRRQLVESDPTLGTAWGWGTGTVVVAALAEYLDKPFAWAVGYFFGNTELSMEPWNVIVGISGFYD